MVEVREVATKMTTVMETLQFVKTSVELPNDSDTAMSTTISEADAELIVDKFFAKLQGEKTVDSPGKNEEAVSHEDLGIEIRDSKRSVKSDIAEIKSLLNKLINFIEKRAMTFDQIYDNLCIRIVREHRNSTGRTLR